MKKSLRFLGAAAAVVFALSFSACSIAVCDDGTDQIDYTSLNKKSTSDADTTGSSGSSSSAGNWMLCKNTGYEIFDIQVWGDGAGTFDFANESDCGKFTVTDVGGGWIGGGLISSDTSKTFDFTGVSKMKFDIRGNISPKALCIAVQNNGGSSAKMYPSKSALSTSANISSLSETDWTSVEFDISGAASDKIINAFCVIAAADWGGSFKKGDYWEVKNLDWVDSDGNSVTLKLK